MLSRIPAFCLAFSRIFSFFWMSAEDGVHLITSRVPPRRLSFTREAAAPSSASKAIFSRRSRHALHTRVPSFADHFISRIPDGSFWHQSSLHLLWFKSRPVRCQRPPHRIRYRWPSPSASDMTCRIAALIRMGSSGLKFFAFTAIGSTVRKPNPGISHKRNGVF